MVPKGKRESRTQRHGGRVVLSIDVEPRVRDALREHAVLAGVSMAEYVSVALAQPSRAFATTSAEIVQPLAQLSYRISRAQQAAAAGDNQAVAAELECARRIAAEAMRPLAAPHAEEVRSADRRRAGGWSG
jgi:N-acyl-L-homoserine lactone synthetase